MCEIRFKGKIIYLPDAGKFWIPTAKVELISEERKYFCEMLVDSGADITLIRKSLGKFLGFSFDGKKIQEIRGIGAGTIPYVIEKIEIKIGEYKFETRIGISMVENIPLILGRLDVFNNFDIEFKQKTGITIFRKA